jgi:tetrapyrrole methylase family protein/MazG family protein
MSERPTAPSADLHPFDQIVEVMRTLRSEEGCPWDREQTLESLKSYCLEECYEVLDAIDAGDPNNHRDELGDLLLQIIFQSQIRWEEGAFEASDVCRAITEKMLRRHPHVFADHQINSPETAHRSWETIKAEERLKKAGQPTSALEGVPRNLPALLRAQRLSQKASVQGFDWQDARSVLPKVREEWDELSEALELFGAGSQRATEELGDLLFAMTNLARHLDIDAEAALRGAGDRFTERFTAMEGVAATEGRPLAARSPEELEQLWERAKAEKDIPPKS